MVVHKRVVFRMDDERRLSDIAEPRHGAALPVIIQRIGEAMDFGGDHIVKFPDAAHPFELA